MGAKEFRVIDRHKEAPSNPAVMLWLGALVSSRHNASGAALDQLNNPFLNVLKPFKKRDVCTAILHQACKADSFCNTLDLSPQVRMY